MDKKEEPSWWTGVVEVKVGDIADKISAVKEVAREADDATSRLRWHRDVAALWQNSTTMSREK